MANQYTDNPQAGCSRQVGISTRDTTQVEEEFRAMHGTISLLEGLLDVLGGKITPVLRSELPQKVDASTPECGLVPLAEEIRTNRRKLEIAADRILSWLNRIELA